MAIGKTGGASNKNLFSVRVITKDKDKKPVDPHFSFVQKVEGVYKEVQTSTSFNGNVTSVTTKLEEYQGNPLKKVIVKVEDESDVYYVDFNYTILSRSVFNTLLNVALGESVKFSIYLAKANPQGKRYPQISLWRPVEGQEKDEMIRWKFQVDELPPTKKVRVKGQDITDTEDVDNFFEAEIQKTFGGGAKAQVTPKAEAKPASKADKTTKATKTVKAAPADEDTSDIPF